MNEINYFCVGRLNNQLCIVETDAPLSAVRAFKSQLDSAGMAPAEQLGALETLLKSRRFACACIAAVEV